MAVTIPVIIMRDKLLIKKKGKFEYFEFAAQQSSEIPNVPFYHEFAKNMDDVISQLKEEIKREYSMLLAKPVLAVVVPDDTSSLELAFIQSFFLNFGKAVALTKMSQTLSQSVSQYISLSKTERSVALQYVNKDEIFAERYYDSTNYDIQIIKNDIQRLHIDVDYHDVPIYINNLHNDMADLLELGQPVNAEAFKRRICDIKIEKNN